jgi:hypothetical protein
MRLHTVPTATPVASLGLASSGLAGCSSAGWHPVAATVIPAAPAPQPSARGLARAGARSSTARPADDEAPVRLDWPARAEASAEALPPAP